MLSPLTFLPSLTPYHLCCILSLVTAEELDQVSGGSAFFTKITRSISNRSVFDFVSGTLTHMDTHTHKYAWCSRFVCMIRTGDVAGIVCVIIEEGGKAGWR